MTKQPAWKRIANLGDVNPIDYGGYFVYVDTTGVYPPEAEVLISPDSDDAPEGWTVYRFILDQCTFVDGVLSDNSFHPELPAWWADELPRLAAYNGQTELRLVTDFCSDDPIARAWAYRSLGDYYGYHELDSYPLRFHSRDDVEARYPEDV